MFEWDQKKAKFNLAKHGISFEEASSVFFDPHALDGPDIENSIDEPRSIRLGTSILEKILVVVYTERSGDEIPKIRIISARKAIKKERKAYQG